MKPMIQPSKKDVERALHLLRPWEWVTHPLFLGLEQIPSQGPVLLVGNHTIMGLLDAPIMFQGLFQEKEIMLRALGDRMHFKIPVWRDLLTRCGVVEGSRENCARLMENGEYILVYPGGNLEVMKKKNQQYQLMWRERIGFVQMAIRHACPIVPFSAVGAEECYEIVKDSDELLASPFGGILKRLHVNDRYIPPLVRGVGPTPVPRPQRFYFKFGIPLETSGYQKNDQNLDACYHLRDRVKHAVESGIRELQEIRAQDPESHWAARLVRPLKNKRGGSDGRQKAEAAKAGKSPKHTQTPGG